MEDWFLMFQSSVAANDKTLELFGYETHQFRPNTSMTRRHALLNVTSTDSMLCSRNRSLLCARKIMEFN